MIEKGISVVIPNYNGELTIGKCLEAAFSSTYNNFEVIVVDDCSDDRSVEIIKQFPCKLIRLDRNGGASMARNVGAMNSSGDLIFFTDADCLLKEDTLSIINNSMSSPDCELVIGGTYTNVPYDKGFFGMFQSVFVNYSETKKINNPDYVAAHAMIMSAETFRNSKGFPEVFLPIIEDVEFSHRLKAEGKRFIMNPDIEVRHIFDFTLFRSLTNSIKKSMYWTIYSLQNRDAMTDSGCASVELKANVGNAFSLICLVLLWIVFNKPVVMSLASFFLASNIYVNRNLFGAYFRAGGLLFGTAASCYYIFLYSFSVGIGVAGGILKFFTRGKTLNRSLLKSQRSLSGSTSCSR